MEYNNKMKIICLIIFSEEKNKGLLCDALIEILPGVFISNFKLINGRYGKFLSPPDIYRGKKKRVKIVNLSKIMYKRIFHLVNDAYEKYLSNKEVDFRVIDKRNDDLSGFEDDSIDDEYFRWNKYKDTGHFEDYEDYKFWQDLADDIGSDPEVLKWNLD